MFPPLMGSALMLVEGAGLIALNPQRLALRKKCSKNRALLLRSVPCLAAWSLEPSQLIVSPSCF